MATYKVIDAEQLDADMTSVADAIRTKGGTAVELEWPEGYKTAIAAIETGVDTSDATADAYHIYPVKTAYANGVKLTGSTVLVRVENYSNSAVSVVYFEPIADGWSSVGVSGCTTTTSSSGATTERPGTATIRVALGSMILFENGVSVSAPSTYFSKSRTPSLDVVLCVTGCSAYGSAGTIELG